MIMRGNIKEYVYEWEYEYKDKYESMRRKEIYMKNGGWICKGTCIWEERRVWGERMWGMDINIYEWRRV